jgi:hypothetical protein
VQTACEAYALEESAQWCRQPSAIESSPCRLSGVKGPAPFPLLASSGDGAGPLTRPG